MDFKKIKRNLERRSRCPFHTGSAEKLAEQSSECRSSASHETSAFEAKQIRRFRSVTAYAENDPKRLARNFRRPFRLGLVPLDPIGTGRHGVVVPLEPQFLLAEHVRLEALPGLDLEVVERAAVGT